MKWSSLQKRESKLNFKKFYMIGSKPLDKITAAELVT